MRFSRTSFLQLQHSDNREPSSLDILSSRVACNKKMAEDRECKSKQVVLEIGLVYDKTRQTCPIISFTNHFNMKKFHLAINEGGVEKVGMQLLLIMTEGSRFLLLLFSSWGAVKTSRNSDNENCNWRTWRTILKTTTHVLLKNNTIIHPCNRNSSLSVLVESFTWLLS